MRDIRITFKDKDFAAVSRSLIDLGVAFQVEPVDGGPAEGSAMRAERPPAARVRQGKDTSKGAKGSSPVTPAARRLRDLVHRNRTETAGGAGEAEIPADLSEKLLPYGGAQEGQT